MSFKTLGGVAGDENVTWNTVVFIIRLPISFAAFLVVLIGVPLLIPFGALLTLFAMGLVVAGAVAAVVTNQREAFPTLDDLFGFPRDAIKAIAHPFIVIWEYQTLKRKWFWE